MTLPKELTNILELAKNELMLHPRGELILPIRRHIWESFGEFEFESKYRALPTTGLKRRVKLASLCVNKVLDIWKKVSQDDNPIKMLSIAEQYINFKIDYDTAINKLGSFPDTLINLASDEKFYYVVEVGFASTYTVKIALRDEDLLVYGDDTELDDNYDSFSWDASYYAAIAYSGSGPWDNTNIDKRREFWLWYINEAVPEAYKYFTD